MPKNPNEKSKHIKQNTSMTSAVQYLLAGCVAELYLLIVQRYYINGNIDQVLAWDHYLPVVGWIGLAVLAVGGVLSFLWKAEPKKRSIGWTTAGIGLFLAASSLLVHWNMAALPLLNIVVPVAMLLGILWSLYDRECAASLTILSATLIVLWICRRQLSSIYFGTYVKILAAIYIVALVLLALLVKQGKFSNLLPANADHLPVYIACTLSVISMLIALVSSAIAYYAMWILGIVVFALAVYYTVKQL